MAEQFIESTLMDGYVGGPHITETQTGLANQGLYGPDDYVLSAGRKAEAQILTNNSIRIFDAVFVIQGRRDVIAANDYTDVSIDNGAQGMNRNDIIVRRYTKDESSEIENTEYAVIKGTPTSGEAEDPAVTIGDIRSGALEHEMKLYRVKLEGLNIVAVEPLFQILMDMSTLNANLSEKVYDQSDLKIADFYTVAVFDLRRKGNEVFFNASLSLSGSSQFDANTLYAINPSPIISELRPQKTFHLDGFGCDAYWGNPTPMTVIIEPSGYIKYTAPSRSAFFKLSGHWFTD